MAKRKQTIHIQGSDITVRQIDNTEYISLTDMTKGFEGGSRIIENWLRTRGTLNFLGAWEQVHNASFSLENYDDIMRFAGDVGFTMSVKKWIEKTGAVGILAKQGRGGGTYAHRDIAFEFATAISPMFKVLLIKEFQRLKQAEIEGRQWDYHRFLSKVNYRLQTDTIRDHILPTLQVPKNREWLVYADEADLLNMSVFGTTAKQWRDANPAKGDNIRDHADIVQLNVLANLESLNAVLIERKVEKSKRFELLSQTAITQYKRLADNPKLIEP